MKPVNERNPLNSKFLQLLEYVRVAVCFFDRDGAIFVWNKTAEDISGYSRGEVVGQSTIWRRLFPDEAYFNKVMGNVNTIISNNLYEENLQTKIVRKDGEIRIVSWNFRTITDEANQATGSVAFGRDVTEQVRIQKELERRSEHLEDLVNERTRSLSESEQRLYAIIQGSPEGIVVIEPNGNIVECNQAALELFASPAKEQLVGRAFLDLVLKRDLEIASISFSEIANVQTLRNLRYAMLRIDGPEFPAEVSLSVVRDNGGSLRVYVAIVRDLTEQNEVTDRLRRAERMAVIGETVAMVGHDLRNPLQAISGALYVLRMKFGRTADPETTEMFGIIETGLQYADNIVKELLDYSREIRLEITETNLQTIIQAVLLQIKIPSSVTVKNTTPDISLQVDVPKIQRVFTNIIANAIDAMPKGGTLTITGASAGQTLEVKISDTGEGISDETMRNLWKPLKTTKSKGMGLGLAICKRIVEAHAGSIEVESSVGIGTTFTIKLPTKPRTSINAKIPT